MKVMDLICINSLEFVDIKEIKLLVAFDFLVYSLWGNLLSEWSFKPLGG